MKIIKRAIQDIEHIPKNKVHGLHKIGDILKVLYPELIKP